MFICTDDTTNCFCLMSMSFLQVGIYLFDSYNPSFRSKNFAIGSAAIIHPLFCVTVADCVHTRITLQNEA